MEQGALGMVGTTFRRAGQAGLAYYTLAAGAVQGGALASELDQAPPCDGHSDAASGERRREAGQGQGVGAGGGMGTSWPADARGLHKACGFAESVYLATCNRVELFFVAERSDAVAHYRQRVYDFFANLHGPDVPAPFADARGLTAYAGEGAAERLFVVASSLDSMVPGEAQILGQVKAALAQAKRLGLCGRQLSALFEEATVVAKKVRATTSLGRGRTSMVSLAIDLLAERLEACAPATLVVVGAGEMAEHCGQAFARRPGVRLLFVNRTLAAAQQLAQRFGGAWQDLTSFRQTPPPFAAMLTSTASPTPLFAADFLHRLVGAPLLVDLSVNRDVDLAAAQHAGTALWDIDRLEGRARRHHAARRREVAQGRTLVDEALERYRLRQTERSLSQALSRWRAGNAAALQRALQPLRRAPGQVAEAGEVPLHQVERWAHGLLATWMHGPTHGLKRVAHLYGHEAVAAFVDAARLPADPTLAPGGAVPGPCKELP